ncbi:hypothetical protein CRENBAI_017204 [Crenichthys baileyi]|uniref:Uncharacterized protein n=1 Tax=Crenichthys baileyi TaxID=28760 RepID=A0AAV9RD15_9TELE
MPSELFPVWDPTYCQERRLSRSHLPGLLFLQTNEPNPFNSFELQMMTKKVPWIEQHLYSLGSSSQPNQRNLAVLFDRSGRQQPLGATSPRTKEVVPFPPWAETGRQAQTWVVSARPPPRTQSPPTPRGGYVQKRGPHAPNQPANQSRPRTEQSRPPNEFRSRPHESPTPSEPQHEPRHRDTPNRDTDIEHTSPNPNATNPPPPPQGHTPTGELYSREADEVTPTQRKLYIHMFQKSVASRG